MRGRPLTAPDTETSRGLDRKDVAHAARSGGVQVLTILLQAVTGATQVVFARLFGPTVYGMYQALLAVVELGGRAAAGGAD